MHHWAIRFPGIIRSWLSIDQFQGVSLTLIGSLRAVRRSNHFRCQSLLRMLVINYISNRRILISCEIIPCTWVGREECAAVPQATVTFKNGRSKTSYSLITIV